MSDNIHIVQFGEEGDWERPSWARTSDDDQWIQTGWQVRTYEGDTLFRHNEETPVREWLASQKYIDSGDGAHFKKTEFVYPHFQTDQEGKKKTTLLTIAIDRQDMRHTLAISIGALRTTLNAHDTARLISLLKTYQEDASQLSQELDALAREEDEKDQAQIEREWRDYRNEGLGRQG